jgi:FMN-binding domain
MRRALLTLGGTAAGLAALFSFKTHSLPAADPTTSTPAASPATSQPMASGTGPGSASPAGSASIPVSTRTVTGTVANTQYGPMQVKVALAGMKITKVTVLQRTDDGAESDEIDGNAIPKLTSETLVAQSAHIDAVSGASYTSSGYIQSLQSALDQAGA